MNDVTQVNCSEIVPITCLGKYDNKDGENVEIKDTFTFKGETVREVIYLFYYIFCPRCPD